MIIVQLKGGFGNQLFQYAAGLCLAIKHNVEIRVDISQLQNNNDTIRTFELGNIMQPPQVATKQELQNVLPSFLLKNIEKILPPYKRKVYKEMDFTFDQDFLKAKNNIFLKGYRQSEKYFLPIADTIKKHFLIPTTHISIVLEIINNIKSQNSISIHLRKGDYANEEYVNFHGILSVEYYQNAINLIKSKISNPKFYIFSDDINFAKNSFTNTENMFFVDQKNSTTALSDFYLMQHCKHNIIANSSFSWWAAYLNPNPNKIVVAPKKWFNKAPYNTKDLFPPSWIVV